MRAPDPHRFRDARSDRTLAVLEGIHPLKHALRFGATILDACTDDADALDVLVNELAPDLATRIREIVVPVDRDRFAELAPAPLPSGVIAIAQRREWNVGEALAGRAPAIFLESPSHPGNIGAVIRVAAAAEAGGVLTSGAIDPWTPAALRGAAGLHYALPVVASGVDDLPVERLIAVDPDGEPFDACDIPANAVLAFGSERRGLSPDLLDRSARRVALPMRPGVSSLNLATAVAAVLYLWRAAQ